MGTTASQWISDVMNELVRQKIQISHVAVELHGFLRVCESLGLMPKEIPQLVQQLIAKKTAQSGAASASQNSQASNQSNPVCQCFSETEEKLSWLNVLGELDEDVKCFIKFYCYYAFDPNQIATVLGLLRDWKVIEEQVQDERLKAGLTQLSADEISTLQILILQAWFANRGEIIAAVRKETLPSTEFFMR